MQSHPIYDPGAAITGRATGAAVVGGRFVAVAAAKPDGEPTPIAHALATGDAYAIGVSGDDAAKDTVAPVYGNGFVLPVEAGGAVTAGKAVEVMDTGVVQNLTSGRKVGVALTTAADDEFALIRVQV